MFCIAAFIVLLIISIFSAKYRTMMKRAWGCVGKKLMLRPCDTSFKQDLKDHMLSKVANKSPRMVKSADVAIEIGAILIVLLTVWSVFVVVKSGLNLFVYGTCNPTNSSACSLGAEACSIEKNNIGIAEAITSFKLHTYAAQEVSGIAETVSAIPARLKSWDAKAYVPEYATYAQTFNEQKPTAVEIIDPGCQFCRELYNNMKQADFTNRYNVTYIAFPIPSSEQASGYKFQHSYLVSSYLEATRRVPLREAQTPADWQLLDIIFTGKDGQFDNQTSMNSIWTEEEMNVRLTGWLQRIGYSDEQIKQVSDMARSEEVKQAIEKNRRIVQNDIKTVKIPTIIFDGRRIGGVLTVEELSK
jgi:hypothetical protein